MKKMLIIITISILVISCSKTVRISENSNWYLEEETNMFGKTVEYTINSTFDLHNNVSVYISLSEQKSLILLLGVSGIFDGIINNEVEITFDNTKPVILKYQFNDLQAWDKNTSGYDQLMSGFSKYNKIRIQGVGCKECSVLDLKGFAEIYKDYKIRTLKNKLN